MKYLKFFEDCIKHSDPIAINHILRDFSRKLEDIVIALQESNELLHKNTTVRRYFHEENEKITIVYTDSIISNRLLKIELKNEEEYVKLSTYLYLLLKQQKNQNYIQIRQCLNFFNFIDSKLKEYSSINAETPNYLRHTYYFPLTELNTILDKLEEYYTYIDADKYNL